MNRQQPIGTRQGRKPVPGAELGFEIDRVVAGHAYPRNGNVHNPTPRYRWELYLDGRMVDSSALRGTLVRAAKQYGRKGYAS